MEEMPAVTDIRDANEGRETGTEAFLEGIVLGSLLDVQKRAGLPGSYDCTDTDMDNHGCPFCALVCSSVRDLVPDDFSESNQASTKVALTPHVRETGGNFAIKTPGRPFAIRFLLALSPVRGL